MRSPTGAINCLHGSHILASIQRIHIMAFLRKLQLHKIYTGFYGSKLLPDYFNGSHSVIVNAN